MQYVSELTRIFFLAVGAFTFSFLLTPAWTNILYKYRLGKSIREGATPIYTKLHKGKEGTPAMGGVLIWVSVLVIALIALVVARFSPEGSFLQSITFLSREETWLPLAAMIVAALIGAVDDIMNIKKIGPFGGGLRMKHRLFLYLLVAIGGAWWFYYKLGWDLIHVPGIGDFNIGWWYIPLFILVIVATSFSVNETDGEDGLAGGVLLAAFAAFGTIAFVQGRYDLSAFCGVIIGALLSFLWFNINPARFFMGDSGAMALGVTLGVVAMLTNSVLVLPIIGFVLVMESASVIIQMTSKKLFKRKVFLSAPIHHHFEAIGWPETKITMRFWIIAAVSGVVGLIIGLIGRGNP